MSSRGAATAGGRREENKREKRARIEAAARRLFGERGYESTTTREIARAAGVGVGTVFVYFRDKLDLLFRLFAEDVGAASAEGFATAPAEAPLPAQVGHVFHALFGYYERDPAQSRVFVKELLFLDDAHRGAMAELTLGFIDRLAALVERAQARGEVAAGVYPRQAAHELFAIYYYGLVAWLGGALPLRDVERWIVAAGLEHITRGLAPREDRDG